MLEFVKVKSSFWSSSIRVESAATRLLFLALHHLADRDGIVTATPAFLADYTALSQVEVKAALARLQEPDPESTTQEEDGRRVVPLGVNRVKLVNFTNVYPVRKAAQTNESRREYMRRYMRDYRKETEAIPEPTPKKQRRKLVNTEDKIRESLDTKTLKRVNEDVPENIAEAWQRWIEYRRQRKLPTYKPLGAQRQIAWLAQRAADATAIVDESIRNNWQGLFELKTRPNEKGRTLADDARTMMQGLNQ